jgi:aminoglycoside phosphotransferase (APT) family kinase protein
VELSLENAGEYLLSRGIRAVRIRELGGGVSNTVLLVNTDQGSFVLKQSLPRLRVKDEWLADRSRILREMSGLIDAATFLLAGSVPKVLWADPSNYLFAMSVAGGRSWKEQMFGGVFDPEVAHKTGSLLGLLIRSTWKDQHYQQKYGEQTAFDQLRIDPYYRRIAQRHPDVAGRVTELISASSERRVALVHGDWSPKNILVQPGGLTVIDFEVVHFGDPSFDAAFCLNHLVLKWFCLPAHRPALEALMAAYWSGLLEKLPTGASSFFEGAALRHLGCLMLARVDGKSPVEYLNDEQSKTEIRRVAKKLIFRSPTILDELMRTIRGLVTRQVVRHDNKKNL